jgi:hypothetical protein
MNDKASSRSSPDYMGRIARRVARQLAWLVMGSSLCSFFGTFVGLSDSLAASALDQKN